MNVPYALGILNIDLDILRCFHNDIENVMFIRRTP